MRASGCLSRMSLLDSWQGKWCPSSWSRTGCSLAFGSKWDTLSSSTSSHYLSLHFFLIVLSTNCLWWCWQVDWIKFEDPQKSFLGKWYLRKRFFKISFFAGHPCKPPSQSSLFGPHFSKCGWSRNDYSIGCVVRVLTWILSLNTVKAWC